MSCPPGQLMGGRDVINLDAAKPNQCCQIGLSYMDNFMCALSYNLLYSSQLVCIYFNPLYLISSFLLYYIQPYCFIFVPIVP
jgi:hypothetical protein